MLFNSSVLNLKMPLPLIISWGFSSFEIIFPGDFVAVGLKERKGPISVYIAEVTHVYEAERGLKYMKKSWNAYLCPEKSNMSQELTEN
jgi:hypothetical protein